MVTCGASVHPCSHRDSRTGRHPRLHPTLSTKPSRDPTKGKAAGFCCPRCLQPSESWPGHQATQPPCPVLPHVLTTLLLPPLPPGGGRWRQLSSSGLELLKGYGGRGHRSSFLPSPPRTGSHHVGSSRRKEKRDQDRRHHLALSDAIWILAEAFCLFSLSDTLAVFGLPCLSL